MYIIYKTTNNINNKIYIGLHKQTGIEFDGYLGSGLLLKRAIARYGRDQFVRETLAVCKSKVEASLKEIYFIDLYQSRDTSIGYNITPGGGGGDVISTHPNKHEIYLKLNQILQERIASGKWRNPMSFPGAREKQKRSLRKAVQEHPEWWSRDPLKQAFMTHQRLITHATNKAAGLHQDPQITSAKQSLSQKKRFSENPQSHGMLGRAHTQESISKMSQTRKERIASGDIIPNTPNVELLSGINNYQFKGWFVTPWGKYPSLRDCCRAENAGITDATTLCKIYKDLSKIASKRSTNKFGGIYGDTWEQLGFQFIPNIKEDAS